MYLSQGSTDNSVSTDLPPPKRSAMAVLPLVALVLISFLMAFAGLGRILNYAFLLFSSAVGLWLYYRYAVVYSGYVWCLWFFVPLLRRIADHWASYTEPSPMLLAPYLVTCIPLLRLLSKLPAGGTVYSAFAVSLAGLTYALITGYLNDISLFTLVKSFLGWLAPLCLSFHFCSSWRNYPDYENATHKVFLWSVLIMGVYGIVQFVALPDWDRQWLLKSGLFSAAGLPGESGGMRVWSTMHSGEPFAATMAAALLLLGNSRAFGVSASVAGYLALLLSTVRSAWLGWFFGFVSLFAMVREQVQIRMILIFSILFSGLIPLATLEPFASKILSRLDSFSNIGEDSSASYRQDVFNEMIGPALSNFVGNGVGDGIGDSAILSSLLELGVIGCVAYFSGLILLCLYVFRQGNNRDFYPRAYQAIIISCIVRMPVNGVVKGASGLLLWGFLGLAVAAARYRKQQQANQYKQVQMTAHVNLSN